MSTILFQADDFIRYFSCVEFLRLGLEIIEEKIYYKISLFDTINKTVCQTIGIPSVLIAES
jgi:hypothetical protein